MKKLIALGLITLSAVTLVSCSSENKETKKVVEPKTEKVVKEENKIDNRKYEAIITELENKLDPEKTGQVKIKVKNDILDSEYPDGHNVIRVLLDGEAKENAKKNLDAVYSNTATNEQKNSITMFRKVISDYAKRLPDTTTTIDFGYEKSADQYDLIAKSSKEKDIIPIGELETE